MRHFNWTSGEFGLLVFRIQSFISEILFLKGGKEARDVLSD